MVFPNIIITDKGVQFTLDYIKKKTYRQIYIEFFFFFLDLIIYLYLIKIINIKLKKNNNNRIIEIIKNK